MENSKLPYKSMVVLFVALVAGVLASLVVKHAFVKPKDLALAAPQGRVAQVLVARNPMMPGDEISALNIRFKSIPENDVPRDAVFTFSDAAGRKVVNSIAKDSIISLFDLDVHEAEQSDQIGFIPPGFRVVPISIESITSSGNYGDMSDLLKLEELIEPGDQVRLSIIQEEGNPSVPIASETGSSARKLVTKPILNQVDVYNVVSEMRPDSKNGRPHRASVISLLLSRDDANKVERMVGEGRLRLSVLNSNPVAPPETQIGMLNTDRSPVASNLVNGLGTFQLRANDEETIQIASQPTELPIASNDHFVTGFERDVTQQPQQPEVPKLEQAPVQSIQEPQTISPLTDSTAEARDEEPVLQRPAVELVSPSNKVKQTNWNAPKNETESLDSAPEQNSTTAPAMDENQNPSRNPEGLVEPQTNPQPKNIAPRATNPQNGFRPRPVDTLAAPPVAVPRPANKVVLSSSTAYLEN